MLLGVITPAFIVEKVGSVARDIPQLNLCYWPYEDMRDAPRLAAENQDQVDGLLFAGTSPYFLAANALQPAVPWFYLERPVCGLSFAFLRARALIDGAIDFSVDTLTELDVQDSVSDFDFSIHSMYHYPHRPSERYDKDLLDFHLEHFRAGRTKFCMSCSYKTSNELARMGVPVFFVYQAPFTIRKTLLSITQSL
ncbi:MAG: hypothetical protein LBL51_01810, partial [Synergistaceae bacterium]|nr:hypothetical protein [Synergistaceae bacterium]